MHNAQRNSAELRRRAADLLAVSIDPADFHIDQGTPVDFVDDDRGAWVAVYVYIDNTEGLDNA